MWRMRQQGQAMKNNFMAMSVCETWRQKAGKRKSMGIAHLSTYLSHLLPIYEKEKPWKNTQKAA